MRYAIKIIFVLELVTLHASYLDDMNLLIRNKKMSIYGIKNDDKNTSDGIGLFYNTQDLKFKVERSNSSFKTGAMIQANPFQNPMYVNIGGNYINEKNLKTDVNSNNVNQYSGALAIGYNLNNLYLEAGENISKLNGFQLSEDTSINGSLSKETYAQLGKRFETTIGTIDTQIKGNQIYNTLATKEKNYESSINYYLDDAIKVGYFYTINQNEISNVYSIDFGYCSTQYTQDVTQDSYNIMLGLKANFTDITKLSTYKAASKAKKKLLKSHKFDYIILQKNMHPSK